MNYAPPKTLAYTGASGLFGLTLGGTVAMAVMLIIVGGMLFAISRGWLPRIAVEPIAQSDGHRRLRLTKNGRPIW